MAIIVSGRICSTDLELTVYTKIRLESKKNNYLSMQILTFNLYEKENLPKIV